MSQVLDKVHDEIFTANSTILQSYLDSTNELTMFEFRPPGGQTLCRVPMIILNPPNTMKLKSLTVVEEGEQVRVNSYVIEYDATASILFRSVLNTVTTNDVEE